MAAARVLVFVLTEDGETGGASGRGHRQPAREGAEQKT